MKPVGDTYPVHIARHRFASVSAGNNGKRKRTAPSDDEGSPTSPSQDEDRPGKRLRSKTDNATLTTTIFNKSPRASRKYGQRDKVSSPSSKKLPIGKGSSGRLAPKGSKMQPDLTAKIAKTKTMKGRNGKTAAQEVKESKAAGAILNPRAGSRKPPTSDKPALREEKAVKKSNLPVEDAQVRIWY
jgi:hypothetical protein